MIQFTAEDIEFFKQQKEKNKRIKKVKPVIEPEEQIVVKQKVTKEKVVRPIYSPIEKRYNNYVKRAHKKDIAFDLTIEEFIDMLGKECTYCNNIANGIDRRDSSIGYTHDNSQPCCSACNTMKFTRSHEDFLDKVKEIYLKNCTK